MEGLGAGLTVDIRAARDDAPEIEQIVALQCTRNGLDCDAPVRELLGRVDVGPRRFGVAVDEGRVVSSLCLIPAKIRIGETEFDAGQVEYVATAESHARRGLVRALMELTHGWSGADGQLATVIAGIRYFYRRFGYEYAVPFPRVWLVDEVPPKPSGWHVRRATGDDAATILALQQQALDGVELAVLPGDLPWWERRLSTDLAPSWSVAVDAAGAVRGAASIGGGPPGVDGVAMLGATAISSGHDAAFDALLAEAAATGNAPAVQHRPHVAAFVSGRTTLHPREYSLYVRVPNAVALLDRLRPTLSARLQGSVFADDSGGLVLSLYERSVLLGYAKGIVKSVDSAPGDQDPDDSPEVPAPASASVSGTSGSDHGAIGVPPDLVATLLFGKYGASGLAERHEDVVLGDRAAIADVLFPQLEADITLT